MKLFRITILLLFTLGYITVFAQNAMKLPSMVEVEGGTFTMGNKLGAVDEQPEHNVTVNSFAIGKYEVTYSEFKKFIDATGYKTDAEQPDTFRLRNGFPPRGIHDGTWKTRIDGLPIPASDTMKPVENVSWNDAMAYCSWLSKSTGKQFRLPTEAEWEYAAKGGQKSKGYVYAGSDKLDEIAWYSENAGRTSHVTGQKLQNELGIFDMSGNNREWCADWYGELYYKESPEVNPAGPERGTNRVLRGGSWGSQAERMRISFRNAEFPYNSAIDFGFRVLIPGESAVKEEIPVTEAHILQDLDTKGFVDIYGINFDIGKADVKAESIPIIEQISGYLKDNPQMNILIEGHTDNTGSDDLNLKLSDARAISIKSEIVKRGIDASRMQTKGFGASKPIAENKTAAGRTQNRRVTIKKL